MRKYNETYDVVRHDVFFPHLSFEHLPTSLNLNSLWRGMSLRRLFMEHQKVRMLMDQGHGLGDKREGSGHG